MDRSTITVERAQPEDTAELAALGARTFQDAFGKDNTAENMAVYIGRHFTQEQIAREISDPVVTFYFAVVAGQRAGYTKLAARPAPACVKYANPLEISRIYVDSAFLRQGVGRALLEHSFQLAGSRGHDALWLAVWKQNTRALAFYRQWGFRAVGEAEFVLGNDRQHDYVMARPI